MSDKSEAKVLVEEKVALSLFLDALLREPEEQSELLQADPLLEVVNKPLSEQKIETTTEIPLLQTEFQTNTSVPVWANEPFQVLMFKVAGLTLAVPLHGLNGVVEWTDSLTEMPGHADFYLGLLQHLDSSIPIVDTAKLVFPQDKINERVTVNPTNRINRIVLINEGRWGLACDEVAEVVTLTADQVRWRSVRTKRRWLLGTVVDHMCALLDTDAFAEKLITGEE